MTQKKTKSISSKKAKSGGPAVSPAAKSSASEIKPLSKAKQSDAVLLIKANAWMKRFNNRLAIVLSGFLLTGGIGVYLSMPSELDSNAPKVNKEQLTKQSASSELKTLVKSAAKAEAPSPAAVSTPSTSSKGAIGKKTSKKTGKITAKGQDSGTKVQGPSKKAKVKAMAAKSKNTLVKKHKKTLASKTPD